MADHGRECHRAETDRCHPHAEAQVLGVAKPTLETPALTIKAYQGLGSTIWMAHQLQKAGLDGCVIAVDTFLGSIEHWDAKFNHLTDMFRRRVGMPDLYQQFTANIWHAGVADYVVPVPQTSTIAATMLLRRHVRAGLVHIDAAHEDPDVVRDIEGDWPLITPGGYLIGDDYSWNSVKQAADEFAARIGLDLIVDRGKWQVRKPGAR